MAKFFLAIIMMLLPLGCKLDIQAFKTSASERAKKCKKLCNKEHYNVLFIRTNGKIEKYKIHLVSWRKKIACECVF